MADETPVQVFLDNKLVARMERQLSRSGWSRKELFKRLLLEGLPRLEAADAPLIPESERAAE